MLESLPPHSHLPSHATLLNNPVTCPARPSSANRDTLVLLIASLFPRR